MASQHWGVTLLAPWQEWMNAAAANCTCGHYILYHLTLTIKKKKDLISLIKQSKWVFIQYWLLSTCCFSTVRDKVESQQTALCCISRCNGHLEKSTRVTELPAELATFPGEHCFYLKTWLPNKPRLFWLGCSGDTSSKVNKTSTSLRGKWLTVFVPNDKNQTF